MTTRRKLLWAIPLLVITAVAALIVALPRFVASNAHRQTIEALASSLTGRQVHVAGDLSLALLPAPQLIAGDVSIGGPADEVITARSLTLDIALPALLRGQLAARSLTLQSPRIVLPWPLPDGAATIVPPPWLAALHAQISDGTVSIGALTIGGVDADVFTARNGALSVSGTGFYKSTPLTLSLGLSAPDAAGKAALAIDGHIQDGKLGGHFSGVLEGNSALSGHLAANFQLPGSATAVSGSASITADAGNLTATQIHLSRDGATLDGAATFNLKQPAFAFDLVGTNLAAATLYPMLATGRFGIPGHLTLLVKNLQLPVIVLPEATMQAAFGADGVALNRLSGTLPGGGAFNISGKIDASGVLTGQAVLQANDLSLLAAAFGETVAALPRGRALKAQAKLRGDRDDLAVTDLRGVVGASRATGGFVLRRSGTGVAVRGALHFDQIDLAALAPVWRNIQLLPGSTVAGEISADHATYGQFQLSRLLLDAVLSRQFVIHRLSAALYGGVAVANLAFTPDGTLVAAQGRLAVPAATPLAALLPATLAAPAVLLHAPLAMAAAAAGPPSAIHISVVGSLGDVSVTASPVINIPARSAAGPLTLRHPDAIAALAPFGINAGLAWPGAGSIALRADMLISPAQYGLPDFVLSFGDLTANGKVLVTGDQITADVAADTLALPGAVPAAPAGALPWAGMTRQIEATLTANRIWLGGQPILGASAGALTMTPGHFNFVVNRAALGGGNLSGALSAGFNPALALRVAPAVTLELKVANVAAGSLALPIGFPYTIPAGTVTGGATLNATGFTPTTWMTTLNGNATLTAVDGQITGFDLAAFRQALQSAHQPGWKQAATSGVSNFNNLAIDGTFDHGIFTVKNAGLQGPDGSGHATGSIDLPDRSLALHVTLSPSTPAASTTVTSIGGWATPRMVLPKTP